MSNSWELEKEKERTSFQRVGVPLSLHPSAFLDFFVTSVATAVVLCGSVAGSVPGTTSLQGWGSDDGPGGAVGGTASVFPLGLASPSPPRGSLPTATGEGARRSEKGTGWKQRETGRWKVKQGNRRLICFLLLSAAAVYLEQ